MTIELQRPERRNALSAELIDKLRTTFENAADDDVRAIVLTGAGTVFCAGIDLSGRVSAENLAEELQSKAFALNMAIDRTPVPVIAAINGPAIGAGVQLAIICDLRVVDPGAYFQLPVAKYGLAADNWTVRRLSSLVGYGRARAMLLAAEKLTAGEALACGMANRLGTRDDALTWAGEIAEFAPLSLRHAKRVLNDDGAWEGQQAIHQELFEQAWKSQDAIEAQLARFQKRSPNFRGV